MNKIQRGIIIVALVLAILIIPFIIINSSNDYDTKYDIAIGELRKAKTYEDFENVEKLFIELGSYRDSINQAQKARIKNTELRKLEDDNEKFLLIIKKIENDRYDFEEVINELTQLSSDVRGTPPRNYNGEIGDDKQITSTQLLTEVKYLFAERMYSEANELIESELDTAALLFEMASKYYEELGEYKDSIEKFNIARLHTLPYMLKTVAEIANGLYGQEKYIEALKLYEELLKYNYEPAAEMAEKCRNALKRLTLASTMSSNTQLTAAISEDGSIVNTNPEDFARWGVHLDFTEWKNIISLATGYTFVAGLDINGKVRLTGKVNGIPVIEVDGYETITSAENIIAIASGMQHSVALTSDGKLIGFGSSDAGQLNFSNEKWSDIVSIACGPTSTIALRRDGTIAVTGMYSEYRTSNLENGINSQVSDTHKVISIATAGRIPKPTGQDIEIPGAAHVVALFDDYTVSVVGSDFFSQEDVESWNNMEYDDRIIAIATDTFHCYGITVNGELKIACNPQNDETKPTDIVETTDIFDEKIIRSISTGYGFVLALAQNGSDVELISWGYSRQGQLPKDWANIKIHPELEMFRTSPQFRELIFSK